jgi:hypothetical protein
MATAKSKALSKYTDIPTKGGLTGSVKVPVAYAEKMKEKNSARLLKQAMKRHLKEDRY